MKICKKRLLNSIPPVKDLCTSARKLSESCWMEKTGLIIKSTVRQEVMFHSVLKKVCVLQTSVLCECWYCQAHGKQEAKWKREEYFLFRVCIPLYAHLCIHTQLSFLAPFLQNSMIFRGQLCLLWLFRLKAGAVQQPKFKLETTSAVGVLFFFRFFLQF